MPLETFGSKSPDFASDILCPHWLSAGLQSRQQRWRGGEKLTDAKPSSPLPPHGVQRGGLSIAPCSAEASPVVFLSLRANALCKVEGEILKGWSPRPPPPRLSVSPRRSAIAAPPGLLRNPVTGLSGPSGSPRRQLPRRPRPRQRPLGPSRAAAALLPPRDATPSPASRARPGSATAAAAALLPPPGLGPVHRPLGAIRERAALCPGRRKHFAKIREPPPSPPASRAVPGAAAALLPRPASAPSTGLSGRPGPPPPPLPPRCPAGRDSVTGLLGPSREPLPPPRPP
ncbi:hypothetical protein JRQ81_018878 [Phrynocephalus forsythii]|uniref:Uncharacterized protein n=1 Tax=Phrynocephalus forsythii TaxID=171643 RepID=A0A9Q0XSQ2_9SAUR|nr:hypothetical protein JRQ81_018878 [Phrynocephalus forsythii]